MRDYYNEALRIVWAGGDGGAALELLNQAQAELARVRAELAAERQRREAAEAALAAVPVGAIRLVIWTVEDGPYDEIPIDEVKRWLDTQPEVQP